MSETDDVIRTDAGGDRVPRRLPGPSGPLSGMRAWAPALGLVIAALAIAAVMGPDPDHGPPLDPSSTAPDGAKAVVQTLAALGADVSVLAGAPDASRSTALLLDDTLLDADRDAISNWVAAGGTLVIGDPYSSLNPADLGRLRPAGPATAELERGCAVGALRDVRRVDTGDVIALRAPPGSTACFARSGTARPSDRGGEPLATEAWLVIVAQGRGTIVALGGPGAFTNARLGRQDNAVLAAALLAPRPGERVAVIGPRPPGTGTRTLTDLVATRVRLALAQLALAFVVVVAWRSRRLGRPVVESQPVELAGSELVVAVGHLMQRARGSARAAEILRQDLRRTLAVRLGLAADAPCDQVADAATAWSGIKAERVREVLEGGNPSDEAALVRLAQSVVSIREEVIGGR